VQFGNPKQGAHSDLLGFENGPADASLPGTIRQASTAAMSARRQPHQSSLTSRALGHVGFGGYELSNRGVDTRALQGYLGHRNIQHTVRYTELAPGRFKDFWRD
jgi:site-specific recombinase XerD